MSPQAVHILQQALGAMQADGSLERILARYVGDKLAKEMLLDQNSVKLLVSRPRILLTRFS